MQIKDGVILAGLNPNMRFVLITADDIWRNHGQELVVTSGLDGCHSAWSWHYYGCALDFRTRYFGSHRERQDVANELQAALKKKSSLYGVVLESNHIHTQYKLF